MAAGWALLAICILHTIVFAPHPWWSAWLSGPFRTEDLPLESMVQFWALPGGFVVPGALLAAMIMGRGRRGQTAPGYIAPALAAWGALCLWMVGPSGFLTVIVPVTLLVVARFRDRQQPRWPHAAPPLRRPTSRLTGPHAARTGPVRVPADRPPPGR